MKHVLFNPKSNSNNGKEKALKLSEQLGECQFKDVCEINFEEYFSNLTGDDEVYLVGGDGTIFSMVNQLVTEPKCKIYFVASGTGNDFENDATFQREKGEFILLNDYIKNLPTVIVNGEKKKFINGVGFGLDGMCCQIGDELRASGATKINYTGIAIKQLLFKFKKKTAKVTVDGKEYNFENVWIAPTMKGRFYGGGMMVAPEQNRFAENGEVSFVAFYGRSRLATLIVFPKIFKGEHVKHEKRVTILKGKEIKVEFNEPTALQVDGETYKNVKEYVVKA